MKVLYTYPPNYREVADYFGVVNGMHHGQRVLFAYGDAIYAPRFEGQMIHAALMAHEGVHLDRQTTLGAREWWRLYIDNPRFRFEEELPAHRAEWNWWRDNGTRSERRAALPIIAGKLAAPLYGSLVSPRQARDLLEGGEHATADR